MKPRIIIMAGGTGGHIFPALAVAHYLVDKNWKVSWIGTQQGMESHVIPAQGIDIDYLSVKGLRGKGLLAKINSVSSLLTSLWQVFKIFRQHKPAVVLGMGGYVAAPGGLMARLLGIPLVIHEQNRVPGTTNRLLLNKANKVLEAFPHSFADNSGAIFTGNPLRADFLNTPKKQFWSTDLKRDCRILIIGGSQGAKILNDIVPAALVTQKNITVKHQTGQASLKSVAQYYAASSIEAKAIAFVDDIAHAYHWADIVICRAGAMTVSEVAAAGLPAIFIPLPHAIDDHQTANARYLVDADAGILIKQADFNQDSLITAINKMKPVLPQISERVKNKAKFDATSLVANICVQEGQQ